MPCGRSFVVWPGTQALIHCGEPSRSLAMLPADARVSVSSGPPKQVQPLPPDAALRRRASRGVVAGGLEEDDVVHHRGPLRLHRGGRDEHVLRELRVEQRAVVVVGRAAVACGV